MRNGCFHSVFLFFHLSGKPVSDLSWNKNTPLLFPFLFIPLQNTALLAFESISLFPSFSQTVSQLKFVFIHYKHVNHKEFWKLLVLNWCCGMFMFAGFALHLKHNSSMWYLSLLLFCSSSILTFSILFSPCPSLSFHIFSLPLHHQQPTN